ncbi:DoxX family membrane protein [Fulvivirgaceae bacterium BMA12]|uniref:DoxX family membrane protein n=1 Tax=Agaribacillus aureus TaxID=3051825 RepID=A0ABT8L9T3_9BACT|nr:DoxX family membrane protein [Fulvivirgaceae bacterium BMA12]
MKIATIIIRMLLGALFVFASVAYFFKLVPQPELTGDMKTFNDGLTASGYLLPLVKAIELICGIAFIVGRFVPLAVLVIFSIVVNILCVHIFLAPEGLPMALFVFIATLFLAYVNRSYYTGLIVSR